VHLSRSGLPVLIPDDNEVKLIKALKAITYTGLISVEMLTGSHLNEVDSVKSVMEKITGMVKDYD
jgi:hypothetical protein